MFSYNYNRHDIQFIEMDKEGLEFYVFVYQIIPPLYLAINIIRKLGSKELGTQGSHKLKIKKKQKNYQNLFQMAVNLIFSDI